MSLAMNKLPIRRIAVIGAGLMGHGIALEFAVAGCEVRLHDLRPEALQQARERILTGLQQLERLGVIRAEQRSQAPERVRSTAEVAEACRGVDLVIESVTEDLEVKRRVFAELDRSCPEHTILASNSSSLVPSAYASATRRPGRVLGVHYFNPPYLLPSVELVVGPQTEETSVETVRELLARLGKQVVVVRKEAPGFIANRLQAALFREALSLAEQGIGTPEEIDSLVKHGIGRRWAAAGPFEIIDLAGLDTARAAGRGVIPELSSSTAVSPLLEEKVARGELGVRTGRGFYEWTKDSATALQQRMTAWLARALEDTSAAATRQQGFVGAWRLVSFDARAGNGETLYPLGSDATGRLLYTASGYMGVVLSKAERGRFASEDVLAGTLEERAAAMESYFSYSGTYEVLEDCIIHRIDMASFPNWIGTAQVRQYLLEGNRLTLTTPPVPTGGRELVSRLVWERLLDNEDKPENGA
jgi:3-hydroxybutyryl-CoA dehydrogenase